MNQRLIGLDRVLHSIPEIGLEEYKTSQFIKETLEKYGIKYETAYKTGVLVHFEGEDDSIVAFRADIDGLPLADNSCHISPSTNKGFAHACGHSAHTSILLETVIRTSEKIKSGVKLKKSLLFIFQPGEEGFAGAGYVIADDNFKKYQDNIECFFATHVMPDVEDDSISLRSGPLSAQNINIKWSIEGKGCHGAQPHNGIDLVVIVSELIGSYQTIRSRNIDPDDMFILTVGKFLTGSMVDDSFVPGGARSIIPNNIELEGTARMFDEKYIDISRERIEAINKGYEQAYGITIDMEFNPNYPPMYNDENLLEDVIKAAETEGVKVEESKKLGGSEDFSFFKEIAPTFMLFTGVGNNEKGHNVDLHNPAFTYDANSLNKTVRIFQRLVELKAL